MAANQNSLTRVSNLQACAQLKQSPVMASASEDSESSQSNHIEYLYLVVCIKCKNEIHLAAENGFLNIRKNGRKRVKIGGA